MLQLNSTKTFVAACLMALVVCSQTQIINPVVQINEPGLELPRPYNFGYEFGDGLGMRQHRHEMADGSGTVKGSYGYLDPFNVYRNVEYAAGIDGYRAVIKSNEPGLSNQVVAGAIYVVEPPPPGAVAQSLKPHGFVALPLK